MNPLIQQGIAQKLIRFDEEQKNIYYIHQDKRRNYSNRSIKLTQTYS